MRCDGWMYGVDLLPGEAQQVEHTNPLMNSLMG